MKNRLSELVDRLGKPDGVRPWAGLDVSAAVTASMAECRSLAKSAVCFSCSFEAVPEIDFNPDLLRLPYPVCWVEFHDEASGGFFGFLCCDQDASGFVLSVFGKNDHGWIYFGTFVAEAVGDGVLLRSVVGKNADAAFAEREVFALFAFLTVLNCTNVRRVEHKPRPSQQSVCRALGRQPLFSTWTLELDLSRGAAASEENGGTHASPRIHLRRGHARQYMPGKWCWVQPHVVGSKELGMVHKDYSSKG